MNLIKRLIPNTLEGKIVLGVYTLIVLLFSTKSALLEPDSGSYVEMSPIRSALYPLIINLVKVFTGQFWSTAMVFLQTLVLAIASFTFLNFIIKKSDGSKMAYFICAGVLLYPISKYGNYILTEAFSYSLFIFCLIPLLKWFEKGAFKHLIRFLVLLTLLCLCRTQFIFLYALPFLKLFLLLFRGKFGLRAFLKIGTITIVFFIALNLLDSTYHYVVHDKFSGTPYTGVQLIADALYVSSPADSTIFESEVDRKLFITMSKNMAKDGLSYRSILANNDGVDKSSIINHYNNGYNLVSHSVAKDEVVKHFDSKEGIDLWIAVDQKLVQMALPLIQQNLSDYIKIYIYDIYLNGFRGNVRFLIFLAIFLLVSINVVLLNKNDLLHVAFFLSGVIVLLNYLLVAIVEPILPRYSFYSDYLYFFLLILIIDQSLNRKTEDTGVALS